MAFDPTKPVEYTELDAAEMRAQLNGLKDIIDAQHALITALAAVLGQKLSGAEVLQLVQAYAARNVDLVAQLPPPWSSSPPERDEFNEVRDKVNELVSGLVHPV